MDWQPIETAPKDRPILLYQDGRYAVATWKDTSYQERRLISQSGRRETYEWADVEEGHWETGGFDVYDPTHWCELAPPALSQSIQSETEESK